MTKFPFFLPYGRRGKVCRVWRDGVIGNTKDFDSFIVGSNPARAANIEVLRTRRELEKFGNRAL